MALICDAGALIALERNDPAMWRRLKAAMSTGDELRTHGAAVAQVWRGGSRQASLARVLAGMDVVAVDARLGRRAGVLLGRTSTTDVVDAAVVALATSDDHRHLRSGRHRPAG